MVKMGLQETVSFIISLISTLIFNIAKKKKYFNKIHSTNGCFRRTIMLIYDIEKD